MEPEQLNQEIADSIARPQSTSIDGLSIAERSLSELIEAKKFLDAQRVANSGPASALSFAVIVPPRTA